MAQARALLQAQEVGIATLPHLKLMGTLTCPQIRLPGLGDTTFNWDRGFHLWLRPAYTTTLTLLRGSGSLTP